MYFFVFWTVSISSGNLVLFVILIGSIYSQFLGGTRALTLSKKTVLYSQQIAKNMYNVLIKVDNKEYKNKICTSSLLSHLQLHPSGSDQWAEGWRPPSGRPRGDDFYVGCYQWPRPHPLQVAPPTQPGGSVRRGRGLLPKGPAGVQRGTQPSRQAAILLGQRLHQEEPLGHGLRR